MTAPARSTNPDVRRTLLAALAGALGVLTLHGLLRDSGWIIDTWLTIAVVVAPAAVLRLWRRPGAFDIWIGVVLLVPWLTLRFAPDHAFLGLIPTGGTVHDVSRLLTDLHHTTSTETAPVRSTPAVRLVVCALVGLLTALIDLIAVVGRRGALAGVPLLVVYTVSGAVARHAVAWVWFAAAAAGFLLLLSLDAAEQRSGWGHRVSDPRGSRGRDVLGHSAPRLAAAAILVAVLLPLVVPLPSRNLLADALRNTGSGASGFGAGTGDGGSVNPFASLTGDLRRGKPLDVMHVHISGTDTGHQVVPFYLRVNVLDSYSSQGWRVSDHGDSQPVDQSDLSRDPGDDAGPSDRFTAQITVTGLRSNPPVFTDLTQVDNVRTGTRWSSQDQLLLGDPVPRGRTIVEDVQQPAPTLTQLRDATDPPAGAVARWLQHPRLPAQVVSLVSRLTRTASGPYEAARAINNYFTDPDNGFVYSLDVPRGSSGSPLVDFLTLKQGYCQQYAASMAIMLRQAGVPARVVLGYMHPAPDAKGNFTVTSHDAHAWVEAYFAGIGWIPFDPTPIDGLSGGAKSDLTWAPHKYPSAAPSAGNNDTRPRVSTAPSTSTAQSQAPTSSAPAPVAAAPGGPTHWSSLLTAALVVLGVLVVASVPALVRVSRRRRRVRLARAGDAEALWAELADSARDLGLAWSAARSPRQVAELLGRGLPGDAGTARHALGELAAAVERARYGSVPGAPAEHVGRLIAPVSAAVRQLREGRSTRTRWASRWWPASLGWTPWRVPVRRIRRWRPARQH